MKRYCLLLLSAALSSAVAFGAMEFEDRWVYFGCALTQDADVASFSNVVRTAHAGGMNGVLMGCGLEFIKNWPKDRYVRFAAMKKLCDENGMEIVPLLWSLGYGSMQNYLGVSSLEGMPVEGVPFRVEGTNAVFDASAVTVETLDATKGWQREKGYHRLIRKLDVRPHRRYRLSFEWKSTDLKGSQPCRVTVRNAKASAYFENERRTIGYRPTQDWTPCTLDFSSGDSDSYWLYIGFMNGWERGRFDVRSLTLRETAPSDVLNRAGAPCSLRNAKTGVVYEEGRDYVLPRPKYPAWQQDRAPVTLALPAGSAIRPGDSLVCDCYTPAVVDGRQVSTCLSEETLYTALEDSARRLEEFLSPRKWFLSMDEFRNGGTCAACRARNLTMGEMYGRAAKRIHDIVMKTHPGARFYMWSDMLDPNHNAVKEYYNCRGSFEGAWQYVPKDTVIACWYDRKSELSLEFFASRGFPTLAAAYYDEKPPFAYSRRWRDAIRRTKGATGIMYTTWRHNFTDLPAFCEMLKEGNEP